MKTILPFSRFLFFVFLITNLLFANISFGQIVMLDQADLDYAPGETVYISGSGWHPGETVMLEVANLTNPDVDCGAVTPQPHESWTTVADSNGNFTASWYVNDCELGADLMLGALGETSGFTYEVFFTDANVSFDTVGLPDGINVTVNYRVYTTGSPEGNFTTINFMTPNESSPAIAVNKNQTIEYTFSDIVISGVRYKASGGTAIGANNGAAAQVITGAYSECTAPVAPSVSSPVTYCQGASASVLTAIGSNLLWYASESGGTGSTTAPIPSTVSTGITSYYVSQSIDCESPRAKIDVIINGVNPGVIGKGAVQPGPGCGTLDPGITSVVTAASGSGTLSYMWQMSTNNGENWTTITLATSSQYNPGSFTTTTSFKRITTSILNDVSCSAESNVLTYEVNPIPVVASILPGGTTNVCVGSSFPLSNATLGGVWSSADPAIATVSINGLVSGVASGDVSISYTVTDGNTGCSKVVNKTVHVLALPTAPTAVNYSGVYDGASHAGTATSNPGEAIDWYTTATGTTQTVAPVGTNVGTYSAYAEARNTTSGCKSATRTLVTVVITQKMATVTANAQSKTYGDANPTLTAVVSGTVNGDVLDYSLATTALQYSGVGTYPIEVSLGSNPNYSITKLNALLTIDKRSVEITADAKSKIYGDSDPALTYQISSGSLAFSDAFTGSLSRDAGESVGNYAITQGNVALNSNYTLSFVGADLTIGKRAITITADANQFKCYGSDDPVLTAHVTLGDIQGNDLASGSLERETGEDGGNYTINKGSYTYGSNYEETYVSAYFTINSQITASFIRTNPNHYFGLSGNQTSKVTVTPSGGVGPYTVSISMDRALISNYITNDGDESWVADLISPPGTVTSSNIILPNSGTLNVNSYPLTIATNVNGSYSITVGLLADAGFTATVTDSKGCILTTDKIFIHGEDVRCFAGKSGNAKIKLCHKTGNTKNPCQELCVDESAVAEHLAHGDFLGSCTVDCVAPKILTKSSLTAKKEVFEVEVETFNVMAYPNPSSNQFTLKISGESQEKIEVLVYDMMARLLKRIEKEAGNTIEFGENLPSGEYLILVRQGEKQKSVNIIKK